MNYIDIGIIALLGLSLLFGLIGKAPKKIFKFIIVAGSVVLAYMFTGKAVEFLGSVDSGVIPGIGVAGQSITELIGAKIAEVISGTGINISTDSITSMAMGFVQVIVFWVLAIVLFIVLGFLGGIISSIAFKHCKKHTAIKTLGIFSVLKNAILIFTFLFPIFVFAPVLGSDSISSFINQPQIEPYLTIVAEQVNTSKVIKYTDKAFSSADIKVLQYTTTNDEGVETKCSVYNDVKTLPGLIKLAAKMQEMQGEESSDPMSLITSMEDDDIRELFSALENSETMKEVIVGVIEEALPEGINIDVSDIDLSKEAETFIVMKELSGALETGEIPDDVDLAETAKTLAQSDLVGALAEANPGMLADIPAEDQKELTDELASELASGELTQEQYDSLMLLFATNSGN